MESGIKGMVGGREKLTDGRHTKDGKEAEDDNYCK